MPEKYMSWLNAVEISRPLHISYQPVVKGLTRCNSSELVMVLHLLSTHHSTDWLKLFLSWFWRTDALTLGVFFFQEKYLFCLSLQQIPLFLLLYDCDTPHIYWILQYTDKHLLRWWGWGLCGFNIQILSCKYKDSHYKDNTVSRISYLYDRNNLEIWSLYC